VLPKFREGLLDNYYVLIEDVLLLELLEVGQIIFDQVVSQDCIVEVQNFAEVSVHDEGPVVYSEIFFPCNLNLHLPEFVSDDGSTRIVVIVHILDVQDNEF